MTRKPKSSSPPCPKGMGHSAIKTTVGLMGTSRRRKPLWRLKKTGAPEKTLPSGARGALNRWGARRTGVFGLARLE